MPRACLHWGLGTWKCGGLQEPLAAQVPVKQAVCPYEKAPALFPPNCGLQQDGAVHLRDLLDPELNPQNSLSPVPGRTSSLFQMLGPSLAFRLQDWEGDKVILPIALTARRNLIPSYKSTPLSSAGK